LRHGVYQPNTKSLQKTIPSTRTRAKDPTIILPTMGPRVVSAILACLMGFLWFSIWNSTAFSVNGIQMSGNIRLTEDDLNGVLPVIGNSVFSLIPEEISTDLAIIFPEIEAIEITISFPNRILAKITERTPMLIWTHPDGSQHWIDSYGIAFPIRGHVEGLIAITSYGDPISSLDSLQEGVDSPSEIATLAPPLIPATMVKNILELSELAPDSAFISYSPEHGLGWSDPNGWEVYYGENTKDVSMKMSIYQAIVERLSQEGIQPSLISVEYLDAPFYRTD
ncbi:cell division protein FtsQ/DivIB, partial [Chloroflexota bacterium]